MLQTKSLYFRRVDLLCDPFEGWLPPEQLALPPGIGRDSGERIWQPPECHSQGDQAMFLRELLACK
jgi:hypothetical protein